MNVGRNTCLLEKKTTAIEWKLLIFLVLLMDVKLVVKVVAIAFAFFLQPQYKFGFGIKNPRLPAFYIFMITIAVINFFISENYSASYIAITASGILCWLACIAAVHQVKLFVERGETAVLHNTLQVFFVLNIVASLLNLAIIVVETGFRNPFLYQGLYQKYFLNTGDYIRGISFDTSTTNAVINCFGIIYFLYRKNFLLVLACMATLLITASNFSNVVLLLTFAALFIFKSTKEQKSVMVVCCLLLVLFFAKFSPQNKDYVTDSIQKFIFKKNRSLTRIQKTTSIRETPDSLLTPENRKEKTALLFLDSVERLHAVQYARAGSQIYLPNSARPAVPADSIHTASFQWKRDTTMFQHQLISYVASRSGGVVAAYDSSTPGKIQAFRQSIQFLQTHTGKLLAGNGTGNFSSKLAFRATGLQIAGSFPSRFLYCSNGFLHNHLGLYVYFFSRHADSHSIIHSPASVYDQLLTEYGLLGLIAFLVYYLGFFLRHFQKLTYGLPLLVMLLAFFMVDYWFEQLSIVVLFECMLLINIKEYKPITANG